MTVRAIVRFSCGHVYESTVAPWRMPKVHCTKELFCEQCGKVNGVESISVEDTIPTIELRYACGHISYWFINLYNPDERLKYVGEAAYCYHCEEMQQIVAVNPPVCDAFFVPPNLSISCDMRNGAWVVNVDGVPSHVYSTIGEASDKVRDLMRVFTGDE